MSFRYPTSDDWHPNFERNCVNISVVAYYNPTKAAGLSSGLIKIVVRGADDTVMAKHISVPILSYDYELTKINLWFGKFPNPLTQKWLLEQGFSFE